MTRHQIITRTAITMIAMGSFWSHSICHAIVFLNADPNPTQNAPFMGPHQITGDTMTGMTVTAYFSNGASETVPWLATGNPQEGEAKGALGDWSLTQASDTFSNPWKLEYHAQQNALLTGLALDGMASGVLANQVVFDRTKDAAGSIFGTPGSYYGKDFETMPNPYPYFNIHVTYKGEVALSNQPSAYGDIYRFLSIHFIEGDDVAGSDDPPVGLDGYDLNVLTFYQDTDSLSRVPEPSTLAMGCLALGMIGQRRRHQYRPFNRMVSALSRTTNDIGA